MLTKIESASAIGDALDGLVEGLATEYSRIALFDVHTDRLQGRHQRGFDLASDISKVVMISRHAKHHSDR